MPISSFLAPSAIAKPGVCTSSTRPASPFEGQMIYETDTDMLAIWNGSAWRYVAATTPTNGTVLQVVTTNKSDTFTTTSTSFVDVTGLSVSITPKSTTSTVFVMASLSLGASYGTNSIYARLLRGSTAIAVGDSAGSRRQVSVASEPNTNSIETASIMYVDSPATTSSTTYKIQISTNGAGTAAINRSVDDSNADGRPRSFSSIAVMELAG